MTEDPFAPPPAGAAPVPAQVPAFGQPVHGAPVYGAPVYGAPLDSTPGTGRRNGFGVTALVLGILSLFGVLTIVLGVLLGLLAIVFGALGRRRARRGEADNGGVALAGLITGTVGLVLSILAIAALVAFFHSSTGKDLRNCLNDANGNAAQTAVCKDRFSKDLTGG